jgi:hypothetical protein
MSEELKPRPCPCCASDDVVSLVTPGEKLHPYQIRCQSCGLQTAHHGNFLTSLSAWNTRPDTDRIAALEAENARLLADKDALADALADAVALIGHTMPSTKTALVDGQKLTAGVVWQVGHDLLLGKSHPRHRPPQDRNRL